MKIQTISDKIIFVDKILRCTENKRTYRYFLEIIKYLNELKHDNDKLYEANIHLVDELNAIKKEKNYELDKTNSFKE